MAFRLSPTLATRRGVEREAGELVDLLLNARARVTDGVLRLLLVGLPARAQQGP